MKWGKRWNEHNQDEVRQTTEWTQPGWSEASDGMHSTRMKCDKWRNEHNQDEAWQAMEWTQSGWSVTGDGMNTTRMKCDILTSNGMNTTRMKCDKQWNEHNQDEVWQAMEWTQPGWNVTSDGMNMAKINGLPCGSALPCEVGQAMEWTQLQLIYV